MMTLSRSYILLSLMLLGIAFFPTYLVTSSNSTGQQLFFVLYLAFLLTLNLLFCRGYFCYSKLEFYSICFISILIGGTIFSKIDGLELGSFINHFRFIFYSIVFCLTYNLLYCQHFDEKIVAKSFLIFVLACSSFSLVQVWKPEILWFINPRTAYTFRGISLGGPFVWSYIFAFVMLPYFFYFLYLFISEVKIKYGLCSIFSLIVVVLSQSKAAYLSLIVCYFCFLIIMFFYRLRGYRLFVSISMILFIAIIFVFEMFSNDLNTVLVALEHLQSGGVDSSTSGRLRQIFSVLSIFDNGNFFQMLFGVTGDKLIIENAYFSYLQDYGIVGLITLIFFIMLLLFFSFRYLRFILLNERSNSYLVAMVISFFLMVISIPIFSLGSSPIDANKSSYYFFVYWAIVLVVLKKKVSNG
ncbi:Predicted membrane protein [Photobacterium profundum SS9]|uniref:Predicted membrane protein n=2 Tax=Photobacterium profundum TaxID=74109 RepID=Q6LNR9_PHOPR|nr:Predicted membrane protein [Photobacterium profundum SS9]